MPTVLCIVTLSLFLRYLFFVHFQIKLHIKSVFFVIFKGALSNMKNKLNGTRGFLNQISKKIQIDRGFDKLIRDKEFSNKELKNLICSLRKDSFVENKIDLMLNSYIDSISTDEIKTVKETLNKDFTDYNYFHLSSRCII